MQAKTNNRDGKHDGLTERWYENGQKEQEGTYKEGKENGLVVLWYENGQKSTERIYKDGKIDGLEMYWYETGQKYREMTYQDGELINEIYWTENGLDSGELIFHFKNGEIWKKERCSWMTKLS